jgi:integrase
MKARKEFRQPLAPQVIELLQALPREDGNPHLFVGATPHAPITNDALRQTLQREGYTDITTHGFRSAFSTWAHERTAHSNHTIELSMAHTIGNQVERSYRRGDLFEKRRKLLDDWARFVTTPAAAESGANVLLIGRAR